MFELIIKFSTALTMLGVSLISIGFGIFVIKIAIERMREKG